MRCYLQVIGAIFSKTVQRMSMKFFFRKVSIWVNMQNKFYVPQSHSIGEKCNAIFKISSQFSQKLCNRGTWNFFCKKYRYGLIYKINFKFIGRTVWEKNTMLTCKISKLFIRTIVQLWIFASYHHIFLENCATEEHEIFLQRVFKWVNMQNEF